MYLGLLLVGGTPCVLAQHAATTKAFELKDEIETCDDLDKDPDPVSLGLSVKIYFEDVDFFLAGLQQLSRRGIFDHERDRFEVSQDTLLPCIDANKVGRYIPRKFELSNAGLSSHLRRFGNLLNDGYSLADCLQNRHFADQEATESKFAFRLDNNDLNIEVAVKKRSADHANRFLSHLDRAILVFKEQNKAVNFNVIFDATRVASKDDQIFIVTRLPRAGLDALLAKNAK